MRERALLLALRLAEICEEFSESEIQSAKRILEEHGVASSLLTCVAKRTKQPRLTHKRAAKGKRIDEQRSKAIIEIEQSDPEKYQVLAEFDNLLRKGRVFPTQDEVRKLGEKLSKEYTAKNSRRESISRLMTLMVKLPLNEIRDLLKMSLSESKVDEGEGDYQRLAQFLITGKISPTREQQHSIVSS